MTAPSRPRDSGAPPPRCCAPRADGCPPGAALLDGQTDAELAALAKALAHPARVRILRLLAQGNACICGDIVEVIGLAQSTVSQHLKVMKQAGLIQGEVDGPRVCYCLDPEGVQRLKTLVGGL